MVRGGPVHWGRAGGSFPKVVLSILWMRTRRRAAVSSFESGWSWELTSMMNAEVTAENRPACDRVSAPTRARHETYEDQGRVQILVVLLHELSIVLLGLLAVVFVESGTMVLFNW